jgi:hypothetical protein
MEISWTDHVRNGEVKEQRNVLHETSKRKANWIGHILCRNCLLQHVIEGKIKGGIEVTGRRGRRRRKLMDDLKERTGYSHLKEEALDRTMRRACFGPVVKLTTKCIMNFNLQLPYQLTRDYALKGCDTVQSGRHNTVIALIMILQSFKPHDVTFLKVVFPMVIPMRPHAVIKYGLDYGF